MKIALIADIHANIFALQKVLEDIDQQRVDQIICLGDLVGYGTFPNEVIELIRQREIVTVQGNYDESVGELLLACGCDYDDPKKLEEAGMSLNWSQRNVTEANREWLKTLPKRLMMEVEGKKICFVHGSPRKNNEYLYADSLAIGDILRDYDFDILACGHTHKPYMKVIGKRYIVNAGSAGKPKHGNPRATYALLNIDEDGIIFISREVDYDWESMAVAIETESGMPSSFAELFRTGKA